MKEFSLLQQEAFLVRSCLCIGLNSISSGSIGEKGNFYSGFFNLSIGLERMAKLSIILSHCLENGFAFPTDNELKKFGHNLVNLHETLSLKHAAIFPDKKHISHLGVSLEKEILDFLSEFAQNTRYYNLKALGGNRSATNPLIAWYSIVSKCMKSDATKADLAKVQAMGNLGSLIEKFSAIISTGMGEGSITVPEQFVQNALIHHSSKYVNVRVLRLIKIFEGILEAFHDECNRIQREKGINHPEIPYFYEFFTFLHLEERDWKRKKRWP